MGRSWPHLGRSWGSKSCCGCSGARFFRLFLKNMFWKKSGVKTRLGTILGRFGSPKGVVLGGQKGPKRHQKRDQNDIKILIDFWIDFGPIWEAQGTQLRATCGATCGMRGARLDSFEFKEFEEFFENYPDTLRPFGWRRI